MKPSQTLLLAAVLTGAFSMPAQASVIAFWNFETGFNVAGPQIVHPAAIGQGTIYQQQADIDDNGKGGNAFVDAANGINTAAGVAMAWDDIAKTGSNDAEFFITFSTLGKTNLVVSFDLRGNAGIIPGCDIKYSLDPLEDVVNPGDVVGTIKDFAGGISTVISNDMVLNAGAAFTRVTVDLSAYTQLNNQAFVALRFDDFDNLTGNDDLRIDNFLITAVPEPSMALLAGAGLLGSLRRRR